MKKKHSEQWPASDSGMPQVEAIYLDLNDPVCAPLPRRIGPLLGKSSPKVVPFEMWYHWRKMWERQDG